MEDNWWCVYSENSMLLYFTEYEYINILSRIGLHLMAEQKMKLAIQNHNKDHMAHFTQGLLHKRRERHHLAIQSYQYSIQLNKSHTEAYF